MVASKKSQSTKKVAAAKVTKAASTKRTVAKRTAKRAAARPLTWRFYAVTIGIFVIAVSAVLVLGLFMAQTAERQQASISKTRYDRIAAIYKSIGLDDSYMVQSSNIFGDKRPYDYDAGRTTSSAVTYIHGDTVSNTATALDAKIKATGFAFVGEPYPGAKSVQYHYKSANGEYIRLTVSSKPRDDALRNAVAMKSEPTAQMYDMDGNAGPSNVLIKVNLDDNNE